MGLLSGLAARPGAWFAAVALASLAAFAAALAFTVFATREPGGATSVPPHDLPLASSAPAVPAAAPGLPGLEVMVGRLEAKLARGDGTAEQWRLLGQTYVELGRDAEARTAFARADALERGR